MFFLLQMLFMFFINFWFMSDGFSFGQKQYEQIVVHRAMVQRCGRKRCAHASCQIGFIEIETLFVVFSSR